MGTVEKQLPKIVITGSNGLLGQKLVEQCLIQGIDFIATAPTKNRFSKCPDNFFELLDITNKAEITQLFQKHQPTHIINTAAMTNVDLCETETERCHKINSGGVKNFAEIINGSPIHFIQLSTDFIFDGRKKYYSESDIPNPLGEYGKSKWKAENILQQLAHPYTTILRTSLVYGVGEELNKSNVFSWAMKMLKAGNELSIVNDQWRTPTFADDLAKACLLVATKMCYGVYNVAGEELHSMYEFIILMAKFLNVDTSLIQPITTQQLSQKAPRPQSSGLNISKAKNEFSYAPTPFFQTLSEINIVS